MPTSRLTIEYDGTDFHGWARQPGLRTVQEELERVLSIVARDEVTLTVAGRTDKGVHARAQIASYVGSPVPIRNVNALLPADIAVLDCTGAAEGFDARRDATARTYRYRVLTRATRSVFEARTSLHHPQPLDRSALHDCAALLGGEHDFTAFTPTETDHVRFRRRVDSAAWVDQGDMLEFWITADSFMRHMNRALVGTMLEVAAGERDEADFGLLLRGAHRREAGPTSPPCGLTFMSVRYSSDDR